MVYYRRVDSSMGAGPVKVTQVPRVGELVEIAGEVRRVTEVMWIVDKASTTDAYLELGKIIEWRRIGE